MSALVIAPRDASPAPLFRAPWESCCNAIRPFESSFQPGLHLPVKKFQLARNSFVASLKLAGNADRVCRSTFGSAMLCIR